MTKDEVILFLKTHGNYCIEKNFSYKFPEYYKDIKSINFPNNFKFSQKLYHYFNNDIEINFGKCVICGKRCKYISFNDGYKQHCSTQCVYKDNNRLLKSQETCIKKYGVPYSFQSENNKIKSQETCIKKYGVKNPAQCENIKQKIENTNKIRHGGVWNSQTKEFVNISKETYKKRYGVDWYTKSNTFKQLIKDTNDDRMNKSRETKLKNKSFNSSKVEIEFEEFLIKNNIQYFKQYKSNLYPFNCDFYIPKYDLYIEINAHWTHGNHPFNENNPDDIELLKLWRSKNKKFYNTAIEVWSVRDVIKINTAIKNKLNYLVVYSKYIKDIIEKFKNKVNEIKEYQ